MEAKYQPVSNVTSFATAESMEIPTSPNVLNIVEANLIDIIYDHVTQQSNGSLCERIRGGGFLERRPLNLLSKILWNRTIVHGHCKTTLANNEHGQAKFIGYIDVLATCDNVAMMDNQSVIIFYLSNVGVTAELEPMRIPTKKLFLVEILSDEQRFADMWVNRNKNLAIKETKIPSNRLGSDNHCETILQVVDLHCDLAASVLSAECTTHNEAPEDNLVEMFRTFGSLRYTDKELLRVIFSQSFHFIGELQDGQNLIWLQNDPKAIYILSTSFSKQHAKHLSVACGMASASNYQQYVKLGMDAGQNSHLPSTKLCSIMRSCHSFSFLPSKWLNIELFEKSIARLSEGSAIVKLMNYMSKQCNLTDIVKVTTILSKKRSSIPRLDEEYLMSTIKEIGGSLSAEIVDSSFSKVFMTILNTTSFFDDDGLFRLSTEQLSMEMKSKHYIEKEDLVYLDLKVHQTTDNVDQTCNICDLGSEPVLPRMSCQEKNQYQGLGCTTVSRMCLSFDSDFELAKGRLGYIKNLLLSIPKQIPSLLRRELEMNEGLNHPIEATQTLWKNDNLQKWMDFVTLSHKLGMLVQSFVVLVSSIKRERLPTWWSDHFRGWTHASTTVGIASAAELIHHITVLDFALVEFAMVLSSSTINIVVDCESFGSHYGSLSNDKIHDIIKQAEELKIHHWNKQYDVYCSFCEDGGDLLCCELCPSVWHKNCCLPSLKHTPDKFVCPCCMKDISALWGKATMQPYSEKELKDKT
jgi:hypothetical protein